MSFGRIAPVIALLISLPRLVWAAPPDPTIIPAPAVTAADLDEAMFDLLRAEGDRLLAQGRKIEAANAYMKALERKSDPLISGRLGVLLVGEREYMRASSLLLHALQSARNATEAERKQFHEAYEQAWRELAWVEVKISVAGAETTLDGKPKNPGGDTRFFLFVTPGEHEMRARHEGYEDAAYPFTAEKGKEQVVNLVLKPLATTVAAPGEALLRKKPREILPAVAERKDLEVPPEDEPENKGPIYGGVGGEEKREKARSSIEVGPVVVFGVATWQPAVGAMVGFRYRMKEYFSVGVEGRGAWLTEGIEGRRINAMTAGGIASLCGQWRWLFACGLGHLGVIRISADPASYVANTDTFFVPGFGGRVGVRAPVAHGLFLGANMDAIGIGARIKVVAGQTVIADHPPVILETQVTGGWEF